MGDPFEAIVGAANVQRVDSELDGVRVDLVVRPGSAEQVAACLVVAREGKRLIISGGRTKLHWGNPIQADSVTRLDTSGLDAALDLQPEEGIVTASAGVSVGRIARAAESAGKCTLLEPHPENATLGGTIAADPIGPRYSLDRRLRGDVLGLQVALPNGEVTRSGGRVVKNVTGFDLVRLYCGSLGTLGVITEATLRLRALPAVTRVFQSEHRDLGRALAVALELRARIEPAGLALTSQAEGLQLLCLLEGDDASVAFAAEQAPGDEVDASRWESLERQHGLLDPRDAKLARVRLGGRPSDTLAICSAVAQLSGAESMRLALPAAGIVFAHPEERSLDALWQRARREGWAIFLERASVEAKSRFDVFGPTSETLPLMHAIKTRFDPGGVLAPGRYAGRL